MKVKFEELGLRWEDDTGGQSEVKYEELVTSTQGRDWQKGGDTVKNKQQQCSAMQIIKADYKFNTNRYIPLQSNQNKMPQQTTFSAFL